VIAVRERNGHRSESIAAVVHTSAGARRWLVPIEGLSFDETPGSPWVLVPPDVRRAFDAVRAAGVPLSATTFGSPLLGVKCGCNDAFLVTLDADDVGGDATARVRVADRRAPSRHGTAERRLLRPIVRGETLHSWCTTGESRVPRAMGSNGAEARATSRRPAQQRRPREQEWIVWTHEESDSGAAAPLRALPAHSARWLAPWRHRLAARSDTRGRGPWWALFRTESADARWPRVVWTDLGRSPRAAVLAAGDRTVPLNSCYVARCPSEIDAHALSAIINSAIAASWLNILAEPARGGFHRYLGWTVGLLPVPIEWSCARDVLGPIGARAAAGEVPGDTALTAYVAGAYGLSVEALAPLLMWPEE